MPLGTATGLQSPCESYGVRILSSLLFKSGVGFGLPRTLIAALPAVTQWSESLSDEQVVEGSIPSCWTVVGSGVGFLSLAVNEVDGGSIPLDHLARMLRRITSQTC